MSEKTMYDILIDTDDIDNIVLRDGSGEETEFEQIATVSMDDGLYCILCPLEDGKPTDDGYVFAFCNTEGRELLTLVTDDKKIDEVFEHYNRAVDETE